MLKAPTIEMYLFGGAVEYIFDKYVMKRDDFKKFQKKVISCQRIFHYSRNVTDFEEIAPVQLGIIPPKDETEAARIYDPLWKN
jgi:hypothetical protein